MASCRAKSWGDGSFQFDMNLNPILGATRRSRSDESFIVDVKVLAVRLGVKTNVVY